MSIVSLFCPIDDFFKDYEKYKASQHLPADRPLKHEDAAHLTSE